MLWWLGGLWLLSPAILPISTRSEDWQPAALPALRQLRMVSIRRARRREPTFAGAGL
jgi:hypothetical protein